jgi:hypothetical protein
MQPTKRSAGASADKMRLVAHSAAARPSLHGELVVAEAVGMHLLQGTTEEAKVGARGEWGSPKKQKPDRDRTHTPTDVAQAEQP